MQPERCRGLFFIFMRFFRRITTTFSDIEEIGSIMKKKTSEDAGCAGFSTKYDLRT